MRTRLTLAVVALVALLVASSAAAQDPPNGFAAVEQVNRERPGLIATDATGFTDAVCRRLAESDARWGRKARRQDDPASRNEDAIAYLWGTDRAAKALVDIVGSAGAPDARPTWQVYGGSNPGNGFWIPCPGTAPPPPPPAPVDLGPVLDRLADLDRRLSAQTAAVQALVAEVEQLRKAIPDGPVPCLISWETIPWPEYTMRSPWGIGTFVLKPRGALPR